jgi:F-type H+-transporting ATPase subunit b
MELLTNLGINGKLLLAQAVNFLILLWVLYKFAYGPILKMFDDRTKKIEKGLTDAAMAGKKLAEMEKREKEILQQARVEAQKISEKSEKQAVKNAENIIAVAEERRKEMLQETKEQLEVEKKKIIMEAKVEVGALVIQAAEKIIGEKLDSKKNEDLIAKAIK